MKKNSFVEGTFIATFAIIIVKVLGVLYVIPFYRIIGEKGKKEFHGELNSRGI